MHSSAVHNAASVDSFNWAGCLVINAETDAADISSPARSVRRRRSWAPVHTSRCAAAIRSRHLTFIVLPPDRSMWSTPPGDRRPR